MVCTLKHQDNFVITVMSCATFSSNRIVRERWITSTFNTLSQNYCHFTDDIFKCIVLNENVWISIKISLKFIPRGPINYTPSLVQVISWHRTGDKPLSEPMMVSFLIHICVTRPPWINTLKQRQKSTFRRWHIQMHFLEWKRFNLIKIWLKFVLRVHFT